MRGFLNNTANPMANFRTHLNVAFAASGVAGLAAYKSGLLDQDQFLLCVLNGTLGGLLPDIDADHSTPLQLSFRCLALFAGFALVLHWQSQLSVTALILLWIAGYLFTQHIVFRLFTNLTVHRGIIHSLPYMAVIASGWVCINYHVFGVSANLSWFYGAFLFFGSVIHLTLDEIYSVDLMNLHIKHSFGSALKLYEQSQWHYYLALYLLLALLFYYAPPVSAFWDSIFSADTWQTLKQGFLPQENWLKWMPH